MNPGFGLFCRCFLVWCCLFMATPSNAALPAWWKEVHPSAGINDWYEYLTFSPSFFGPNAFPVPELSDGRVPLKHSAEVSSDFFWGFGDQTQSLSTRFTYVFVPGRIAVSSWGVLAEHYKTTLAVRDERVSLIENPEETFYIGDLYLSTQIKLLREGRYFPEINSEVVLKTASSSTAKGARYFDTPGYYTNLTFAKSLYFPGSYFSELRFIGMIGFLCYQLNNFHQNDALLYGGKLKLFSEKWSLESSLGGYDGWLDLGDHPIVLRGRLNWDAGSTQYFFQYQHALHEYPYRRFQTGVKFSF